MAQSNLGPYVWWLVSRASGIVALGLISISVLLGLIMATKILRRPGMGRTLVRVHEHVALSGLAAITVHGLALLGDPWLRPSLSGLAIPFTLSYRPLFTGIGIIGGYLAAILGLSFYARRRIGVRLWRRLHRATVLVWLLGVVHTIGAGSDASTPWLGGMILVTGVPIVYLTTLRILQTREQAKRAPRRRAAQAGQPPPVPTRRLPSAHAPAPVRPARALEEAA
jgi:methionine sulfoxide reductase heme-binding subunit